MSERGRSIAEGDATTQQPVEATGVPYLDEVLGGGLPRGALAIIVGPPGSGKTTMACQIAFATARLGRRALILTALSEPTEKLVAHVRTFRFFDEGLLGDPISVLSLEQFLEQGLSSIGDALMNLVRETRADLVVVDGFRGIRDVDLDPQRAREFLYDVGSTLGVRGTTTVITSEAEPHDPAFFPELTTADVILGLHYRLAGARQLRAVEAVKVRGGAPLPGLHGLSLTPDGVSVYPRLEARVAAPTRQPDEGFGGQGPAGDAPLDTQGELSDDRATFGLPGLDAALDGGLVQATVTLVTGSLGTGKSTLGLRFVLTGVAAGEPGLFLGFRETPRQLARKAQVFEGGRALARALAPGGGLELIYLPPVENDPDIVADRLLAALDRTGARRLVIDSIAELERAVARNGDPGRAEDYLAALAVALRRRGVTTVAIKETQFALSQTFDIAIDPIGMVVDNVLLLQQLATMGELRRVLTVIKTRFTPHDPTMHEFVIGPPDGIRVAASLSRTVQSDDRGSALAGDS